LLRDGRYDVLHTHMPYASALGRLVARSLPRGQRPRLVSTAHVDYNRLARASRLLEHATYCLDDQVIAASEATRRTLPTRTRARAETIVHGIDLEQAASCAGRAPRLRAALPGDTSDMLVVTVANLRRQKNYPMLLQAVRILVEHNVPVQVLAVGDGPVRGELEAMRDRLGLRDRVHFLGYRSDAIAIVAAADVFVLTSDYEAATLAVIEAMSVGVPVTVTAVGELPQIVTDGVSGRLVAAGDAAALARCLQDLIDDPDQRTRLADAARRASRGFDVRQAIRRIEQIYADLANA
jgi:glycosyltransferase involved in cell wall biosynthesis